MKQIIDRERKKEKVLGIIFFRDNVKMSRKKEKQEKLNASMVEVYEYLKEIKADIIKYAPGCELLVKKYNKPLQAVSEIFQVSQSSVKQHRKRKIGKGAQVNEQLVDETKNSRTDQELDKAHEAGVRQEHGSQFKPRFAIGDEAEKPTIVLDQSSATIVAVMNTAVPESEQVKSTTKIDQNGLPDKSVDVSRDKCASTGVKKHAARVRPKSPVHPHATGEDTTEQGKVHDDTI